MKRDFTTKGKDTRNPVTKKQLVHGNIDPRVPIDPDRMVILSPHRSMETL